MGTLTETLPHDGGFLVEEYSQDHCREEVTLLTGQAYRAGHVLGAAVLGAASSEAAGGNTGNGTLGAVTVAADAQVGAYILTITEAASNAGAFQVTDPQGDVVGLGAVGSAFSGGGLTFTLADGGTDFAVGDAFTITVADGTGKYAAYDSAATNGTGKAAAILVKAVDATDADAAGVVIVRGPVTVTSAELVFEDDQDDAAKAAALLHLADRGIIAR